MRRDEESQCVSPRSLTMRRSSVSFRPPPRFRETDFSAQNPVEIYGPSGGGQRCIEPLSTARTARKTSHANSRSEAIASSSLLGRGGLGAGTMGRGAARGGRREGAADGSAEAGLFLRFTAKFPRDQERPRKPTRQQGNRVTTKAREHERAKPGRRLGESPQRHRSLLDSRSPFSCFRVFVVPFLGRPLPNPILSLQCEKRREPTPPART